MIKKLIFILLSGSALQSCIGGGGSDRHKVFVEVNQSYIGSTIQDFKRTAGKSVGIKPLANGNSEEEWKSYGSCRYFYEYVPVTGIIVSWRFEGSKTDCVWRS